MLFILIICFQLPYAYSYSNLLNGKPQILQSKFKISYNLLLNFHQYENNTLDFASKSMCNGEIEKELRLNEARLNDINIRYNSKISNPHI